MAPNSVIQGQMISWAPGLVFTIASMSTGIMALYLPETLNRPLADTIEEIENWTRSDIPHSCTKQRDPHTGGPPAYTDYEQNKSCVTDGLCPHNSEGSDGISAGGGLGGISGRPEYDRDNVRFIRDKESSSCDSEISSVNDNTSL